MLTYCKHYILLIGLAFFAVSSIHADDLEQRKQLLKKQFHQYYAQMNLDSALVILDEQIALEAETGNTENEGKARWNKVAVLNNGARYEELVAEAEKQREWFGSQGNWSRYYQCWQRICSGNHDLGRMQTALREAEAMGNDAKSHNNNTGRAMAYKQMGVIYTDIRQLPQAEDAFRRAVELLKEDNDMTGILSGVYEGLGQALDKQKKYQELLQMADEWQRHLDELAKQTSLEVVSQTFVACYLAYANAYIGLQRYADAEKALVKAEEYQAITKTALTRYDIFEVRALLALRQGNYHQAIAYSDSALSPGMKYGVLLQEYRAEAFLHDGQGITSAEIYRKLYNDKDSTFTRDMRTQLDELNTFFQLDELQRSQREAKVRYAMIIVGLVLIAFIIFIIVTRRSARKLAEKNRELAENINALALANDKAEASSRMKTEFIQNMSHEIRTPLNILNGFTQILTSKDAEQLLPAEKADMCRRVTENTERITSLINKLLMLSESNSQHVLECNDQTTVDEIVMQAVMTARAASTADIAFETVIDDTIKSLPLQTNRDYAVRALVQLIDNAFKFTKHGRVTLSAKQSEGCVCFVVEDTGIGIPKEESSHVFEEFVQLDSYNEGMGIGLTMARSIATRLGGSLDIAAEYTDGARFVFTLPR